MCLCVCVRVWIVLGAISSLFPPSKFVKSLYAPDPHVRIVFLFYFTFPFIAASYSRMSLLYIRFPFFICFLHHSVAGHSLHEPYTFSLAVFSMFCAKLQPDTFTITRTCTNQPHKITSHTLKGYARYPVSRLRLRKIPHSGVRNTTLISFFFQFFLYILFLSFVSCMQWLVCRRLDLFYAADQKSPEHRVNWGLARVYKNRCRKGKQKNGGMIQK